MPTDTEAKEDIWAALNALPRPVTIDQVQTVATGRLQGKQQSDFLAWLNDNSIYVLRRLNG